MGNYIPHLTNKHPFKLSSPKRTVDKKEAIRHLLHAAIRMVAAAEDPFAIHMLVQSADKMLIDVAANADKKLAFNFEDYVKADLKKLVFKIIRQTYNFFKHADQDSDEVLEVGEIAKINLLQLAVCVGNFKALYGEITDHMQLIYAMSRLAFPEGFRIDGQKAIFDAEYAKIKDKSLSDFLGPEVWSSKIPGLPNLAAERGQDVQDNGKFYQMSFADIAKKE